MSFVSYARMGLQKRSSKFSDRRYFTSINPIFYCIHIFNHWHLPITCYDATNQFNSIYIIDDSNVSHFIWNIVITSRSIHKEIKSVFTSNFFEKVVLVLPFSQYHQNTLIKVY